MKNYTLKEVKSASDESCFLDMVNYIYQNDNNWVRHLDPDIKGVFDAKTNKLLKDGEAIRWVLFDSNNRAIGRIAAFYNNELLSKGYCKAGGCGFFECIDNQEAANIMFDAAVEWLKQKGVEAVDGSVNFGERDQFWGVLVDGFHHPMYGSNYNPPYYGKLFEAYGFENYFTQHSYIKALDPSSVNPAVIEKAKRLSENPDYEFRSIRKDESDKVAEMFRTVYNKAWEAFKDVPELTEKQAIEIFKKLKPIVDFDIIFFAFYKGEPIGFFIIIPDINKAAKPLKGKFGLFNKLRFLYLLKIKKVCNIMQGIVFGVMPEYQGKGVESGMMMALGEKVTNNKKFKYDQLELVWIGDFNPLMMRMVEGYVCAERYKRYITYRYMIDKNIPFQKHPRVSPERKKKPLSKPVE